jgi:hypothetical protein
MYDYLSSVTADYTSTELSVSPQAVMTERGKKGHQIVHEADDASEQVVSLATDSVFYVTLQWTAISESDAGTIIDFFHDNTKAKGLARSFYWQHPKDGHTYTVKFRSQLERRYRVRLGSYQEVAEVRIKVLGNKP